jgi:hypothetical protein
MEHERNPAGGGATAIYEIRGINSAPTGRLLTDNLAAEGLVGKPRSSELIAVWSECGSRRRAA